MMCADPPKDDKEDICGEMVKKDSHSASIIILLYFSIIEYSFADS